MENASESTIKGTGVVAGVAYAEAVWVRPRPALPTEGSIDPDKRVNRNMTAFLRP